MSELGDAVIDAAEEARNIGATMDCHLNMKSHINKITKGCYYHLRNIGRIRKNLTEDATKTLIQALVLSKIDGLNALLYGLPDNLIRKLQLVQNQAARMIMRLGRYEHITPAMQHLHWLPVSSRIEYKICMLVFKCLTNTAPVYLCDLIEMYDAGRSLRSNLNGMLVVKEAIGKTYGERAFSICAPKLWNRLPVHIREADSLDSFKRDLKTHLFRLAYGQ